MKKCILLVRVSTKGQGYDDQGEVIYNQAIKDGYLPENIYSIYEKESGYKLSEEDRRGLNKMKELIEADNEIDAIYVFALDRLGRKRKVLYSIHDYLIDRKIDLIIKEPFFVHLLNEDKTLNEASDMIFNQYAMIAEFEIRNRTSRFDRTKESRKRNGLFYGGKWAFGYTFNDNTKAIEVDPNNIVLEIFTMYATGNYSQSEIALEMQSRGYFKDYDLFAAVKAVKYILHNPAYIGQGRNKDMNYPRIVSDELFYKVQELGKIKSGIKGECTKKRNDKSVLLRKLLICECGHKYSKSNSEYRCYYCNHSFKIEFIDKVAWWVASPLITNMLRHETQDRIEENRANIILLSKKIEVSEQLIKETEAKIDKLDEAIYLKGKIDYDKGEAMKTTLKKSIADEQKKILSYKEQIQAIETSKIDEHYGNIDDVLHITDPTIKYDLIHQVLLSIVVEPITKREFILHFNWKWGSTSSYKIDPFKKMIDAGGWITL